MAKMDYQISDKNSFFGRFMSGDLNQGSTYDGKNPLSLNTRLAITTSIMGSTLGDTYIFSPNLVSSFRMGANRTNVVKIPDNYGSWAGFWIECHSPGGKYYRSHGDRRLHDRRRDCISRVRSIMDQCPRLSTT